MVDDHSHSGRIVDLNLELYVLVDLEYQTAQFYDVCKHQIMCILVV